MSKEEMTQRLTEMLTAFDELTDDLRKAFAKFDEALADIKQRAKPKPYDPDEDLGNHDYTGIPN